MRLREALELVPPPLAAPVIRHSLGAILSLAVCAMLCGARSLYAIGPVGQGSRSPCGRALGVQPWQDALCCHLSPGVQRLGRGRL